MKESHVEGVATHDDPESCTDVREDGGEALTGARAGRVLSREMHVQDADVVMRDGRQHRRRRHRETLSSPARSKTPCTHGAYLRENREICGPLGALALRAASGRQRA
jgi:hypothetical protein